MVYKITDYAGNLVGNPKGYSSHKSAKTALSRRYKGHRLLTCYLWHVYDEARKQGHTDTLVYSIEQYANH